MSIVTTNNNKEPRQTSESKKFLNHFESINTPIKVSPVFTSAISKNKYSETLEMYGSSISIIDKIADSPVKESKVNCAQGDIKSFVEIPMVVSLNPRLKEKVIAVNQFFNPSKGENFRFHSKQEEGNLNNYIENILSIDMNNILPRPEEEHKQGHSRSKSKEFNSKKETEINKQSLPPQLSLPKPKVKEVEIKEDPIVLTEKSNSKLKKIELLLKEIHYEKKRRGLVPDYLRAIQMKLTEFFDYILHDDPEYFGLSLFDKMKKVLNNMECLKGKKIDGESKIEMLRIFFEEFRDLKNESQKEEEQRENEEHSKPKLKSKSRERKENSKFQEKKSFKNELVYPLSSKSQKNNQSLSLGGGRSSKKVSVKNESKEEDQWIGSL